MNVKNKNLLFYGLLCILILLGVLFYAKKQPAITASDAKIVTVGSISSDQQGNRLASILKLVLPLGSEHILVLDQGMAPYADMNLISLSPRQEFLIGANFVGISKRTDESISYVTDPSYQMLTMLGKVSEHTGELLLKTDDEIVRPSLLVTINGVDQSAESRGEGWYSLPQFSISDNLIIAVKSKSAITSGYLFVDQSQDSRVTASKVNIDKKYIFSPFDIDLSDGNFAAVTVPAGYQITSSSVDTLLGQPIAFSYFNNITTDQTNLLEAGVSSQGILIRTSGSYRFNKIGASPLTIMTALLLLALPFLLLVDRSLISSWAARFIQAKKEIGKNHFWLVGYLVWITVLLVLQIGPEIPVLSSKKFLVILSLLPLLIYARLSLFTTMVLTISCLELAVLLNLVGRTPGASYRLVFLLIAATVITLLGENIYRKIRGK